jgi:hypothetical protein
LADALVVAGATAVCVGVAAMFDDWMTTNCRVEAERRVSAMRWEGQQKLEATYARWLHMMSPTVREAFRRRGCTGC